MTIEVSAKKVEDAIKEGLKTLNATIDQVQIDVISQGGFLKKAKIKMTIDGDAPERATATETAAEPLPEKAATPRAAGSERPVKKADEGKPTQKKEKPVPAAAQTEKKETPVEGGEPKAQKPRRERKSDAVDLTPEIVDRALTFLKDVLKYMQVDAEVKYEEKGRELDIEVVTENSAVIGYRGETLDSIEYLTSLAAGRGDERYVKVRLDCNGYRAKREESLKSLAARMADKCAATGRKVTLEAMSSAHRRIIHAALGNDDRVVTKSEGKDPNRRVVILPKRKQQ